MNRRWQSDLAQEICGERLVMRPTHPERTVSICRAAINAAPVPPHTNLICPTRHSKVWNTTLTRDTKNFKR
jgi:hypothetical protein